MKLYEIVFSPTGGTQKVADRLSRAMSGEIVPVDLTDHALAFANIALTPDDVAVLAVPSYGGRVPAPAVERLAALHGNGARAVLVCVYGNRAYEDTLAELQDTAKQAGFRPIAAVAAVAEHSIARQFAAVSGYTCEDTPYASGFAGYKDWFIHNFDRPGYTIECGLGENPLPLSQFESIWNANLGILTLAALGI